MILSWSVLRRAIRTLHRRQNVPASWENIELSHIHTYTSIYTCWLLAHVSGLFTIKCISVAMTSSLVSAKPWRHVQACASGLCVLSELSTDCWKQSGAASHDSSKFAILLRAYFCAKAHWVVLLSTRRSAKFEQLSATHCNSDSHFLYSLTVQFARHGICMEPLESRQLERSLGYPRMLEESSRSRLGIIVQEEVSCDRQAQDHDGRDKCSEPTCTTSFGCLQKMQNAKNFR